MIMMRATMKMTISTIYTIATTTIEMMTTRRLKVGGNEIDMTRAKEYDRDRERERRERERKRER